MKSEFPTILIDTREQAPLKFTLPSMRVGLSTGHGDYSLSGFTDTIGIERKSLPDLVASLTTGRARFLTSLEGLRERDHRAIVVEGTWEDVRQGWYESKAHPNSIMGSCASIIAGGIPIFFAGSPEGAAALVEKLLQKFHKRAVAAREAAA